MIQKTKDIPPSQIVNMGQTMSRFDMPPRGTNDKIGKKTIRGKMTKTEKIHGSPGSNCFRAKTACNEKNGILGWRVKSKRSSKQMDDM